MALLDSNREIAYGKIYIKYKGVWDMQELYEQSIEWFRKRKYKFQEKVYKHKHPSPYGVERQYLWEATRKETEMIEWAIRVYIHTYDAQNIDVVMPDGSKKVMTKGRIWIELTGNGELDFEKRWNKSKFYANLMSFYHKYIFARETLDKWWDVLWYREIHRLHYWMLNILKSQTQEFEHRFWTGVHT